MLTAAELAPALRMHWLLWEPDAATLPDGQVPPQRWELCKFMKFDAVLCP
jgi:hypothetical protein